MSLADGYDVSYERARFAGGSSTSAQWPQSAKSCLPTVLELFVRCKRSPNRIGLLGTELQKSL